MTERDAITMFSYSNSLVHRVSGNNTMDRIILDPTFYAATHSRSVRFTVKAKQKE